MTPDIYIPRLIEPTRHVRNGHYPNAAHYAQVISAQNHILAYRKKEVYRRATFLGGTTAANNWRFRFRTGYGTRAVRFFAILGLDDHNAAVTPYYTVALTKVGGATQTFEMHYGVSRTGATDAPEEWCPFVVDLDVDEASAYTCVVTQTDNARLLSMTVNEIGYTTISDAHTYFSEFQPTAGAPILDGDIETLIKGSSAILKHNGGLCAHWHLVDGAARTRTLSTPINLIDNATTGTPSSSAKGWRFVTTARNTYASSTVAVEFAVYAAMASGTGTARLITTTGATTASININSATPQWWTAAGVLTVGTGQVYVPQFAGDGTNQLSVYAVSLIEHNP